MQPKHLYVSEYSALALLDNSALNQYHAWFAGWNCFGRKIGNRNFLSQDRLNFSKKNEDFLNICVILVMKLTFSVSTGHYSSAEQILLCYHWTLVKCFKSFSLRFKLYRPLSFKIIVVTLSVTLMTPALCNKLIIFCCHVTCSLKF